MKKTILSGLIAASLTASAFASDGGIYSDTETYTNHTNTVVVEEAAPVQVRRVAVAPRPCAQPVRIKTHTEVIDHYQVYRPVTVYQPAGTYSERRVVRNNRCGRCNG